MTVDDLLILTEDQIDYASLDLDLLAELARQATEPFIATSALASLSSRDELTAQDVCEEILRRPDGDTHLRAYAMTTLYSLSPERGLRQMEQCADSDIDERLLGSVIENVMSDIDRFKSGHRELVSKLIAKARRVSAERFSDPDEVQRFIAVFASQ